MAALLAKEFSYVRITISQRFAQRRLAYVDYRQLSVHEFGIRRLRGIGKRGLGGVAAFR